MNKQSIPEQILRALAGASFETARFVVGLSGGPDSTALVAACLEGGLEVSTVHFNHGLRADAETDERWCRRFCQLRNVPLEIVQLDVSGARKPGESVEMTGRRLRLSYWQNRAAREPQLVVLLGHHQDDLFETAMMRLLRGANSGGIAGLHADVRIGAVRLVRPLLGIPRAELGRYLAERKIEACIDPTNRDERFERNRVRRILAELVRDEDRAGLLRSLSLLQADDDALGDWAESRIDVTQTALALPALLACPDALWPRVLRAWLRAAGEARPLRGTRIRELRNSLQSGVKPSFQFDTGLGITLRIRGGGLVMQTAQPAQPTFSYTWHWTEQSQINIPEADTVLTATRRALNANLPGEYFALEAMPPPLTVRSRQPGDRMIPFGGQEPVRVKKLLEPIKPKAVRCIVTSTAGHILWIPGVRRAEFARVSDGAPALHLSCSCC